MKLITVSLKLVSALIAITCSEANIVAVGAIFNCSPNETIPKELVCDWKVDCSNGEDKTPARCGCPPGKFDCHESCIDENLRCNRKADCPNGRDEENCELYSCQPHQFKCSNNFCIAAHLTCNYMDDCGDNSDEQNCQFRQCWIGELECGTGECVRPGHICDGINDCKNGQDETSCDSGDFVNCEDGTRIHRSLWCDGNLDCRGNHTDETVCGKCPSGQFQCPNGRCLSKAQLCDGQCDCFADCSDEGGNCSVSYQVVNGVKLPISGVSVGCLLEFHPIEKELIILDRFICDGAFDCYYYGYAPDEFNCPGSDLSSLVYGETEYWPLHSKNYFQCSGEKDGRWLPSFLKCDFKKECLHGDDELDCNFTPCAEGQFQCNNHQCIEMNRRCDSKLDCFDKSDELFCESFDCGPHRRKCKTHQCIPLEFWCNHEKDCFDGSDEDECDYPVECGEDEFRCDSGQCIPKSQVCLLSENTKDGCADKSHLISCRLDSCDLGWFKCTNGPCIHNSYVCNEDIDCPAFWNDEDLCPNTCSRKVLGCTCFDITANCTRLQLLQVPTDIEPAISYFNFSGNWLGIDLHRNSLAPLRRSNSLDLSSNQITIIPPGLFNGFTKLKILQLERNRIQTLLENTFQGLRNLHMLYLHGNNIETVHSLAFNGLSSLRTLDLSRQNLQYVSPKSFVGLSSLLILDLSHNNIAYFGDDVLTGLGGIQRLDISYNRVIKLQPAAFHGLTSVKQLVTDEFRICCIAMHAGITECSPTADEFSSCQDLMSHIVLRPCLWVLGILALCGNFYVIVWRMRNVRGKKSHALLVVNLAIGDFCMGVYLILIGAMDQFYRGVYAMHEQEWRNSSLCTLAGVISTFSSEFTVFVLTAITIERFLSIAFPFRNYKMTTRATRKVVLFCWILAALIALIPLLNDDYFRNFYGRSSVCLALHITGDRPNGWEYSFSVFVVLNFLSVCIMCIGYAWMYFAARSATQAIQCPTHCEERSIGRKMLIIVFTDAACWIPIITLGFLSLSGHYLAKDIYAWVSVFVLPLNAALNPFMYTFMVPNYKDKIWRYLLSLQTSLHRTLTSKFSNSSRQVPTVNVECIRSTTADRYIGTAGAVVHLPSEEPEVWDRSTENQSIIESRRALVRIVHFSLENLASENCLEGKLYKIRSCPELT